MSTAARGRSRGHDEEEHENHERWLVSYADMITVLMALFIVLFAISQVDQQKFIQLKTGLADGYGANSQVPIAGGAGLLDSAGTALNPANLELDAAPSPVNLMDAQEGLDGGKERERRQTQALLDAAKAEVDRLAAIQAELEAALAKEGLGDRVRFSLTERGLVASVVADDVFFQSASADLQPTGVRVLDAVEPVLGSLTEEIAVEGHANHLKISTARYPTNWELSNSRATTVLRRLLDDGISPQRLSATGFGDARPLFPIDDPRAIAGNRRVDLVIIDQQPAAVRALIPQLAQARGLGAEPVEGG